MIPLFVAPADGPVSVTSFDAAATADPNKNGVPVDGAGAGFVGIENIGLFKLLPNMLVDNVVVDVATAAAAVVVVIGAPADAVLDGLPNWKLGLFSVGCDPKLNVLLAGVPNENF